MAAHAVAVRRRLASTLALASLTYLSLTGLAIAQDAPAASNVPLSRVVLFNSGVGFFEHRGEIDGDAKVELKFNVDDINDLLKSMVLQDLGGGRISTVTYGSKDPYTKTLKTFAIDLTDNPTLATILGQIRGERIMVAAPDDIEGIILGVEKRKKPAGENQTIEVDVLNLSTKDGLRSVSLEDVGRIKLLNPELDAELNQALALLASSHVNDKKSVTLAFLGQGKRPVRVGYIQEAPIWKTSYRLVLSDEGSTHLQGWAIVENTTEEDWDGVRLTLVSGRPISFQMNLYEPLYVSRQMVEPELFASLRPQTYDPNVAPPPAAAEPPAPMAADAPMRPESLARRGAFNGAGAGFAGGGGLDKDEDGDGFAGLATTGVSAADAGDVGELFQYVIDTPVKLPRQQSAMLPIVNGPVEAEKVSIYSPTVHAKHPLNGLQLTNTSGLHLMQGPITVFDSGSYAGDAQIQDLPPGAKRLVSYALDLDVEVVPEAKPVPEELTSVKIAGGVLHATRKYVRATNYTIKNSAGKARKVLIEQPLDPSWTLVEPESPAEKSRASYRFAVSVEPGKSAELPVREEMVQSQQFVLTDLDDNSVNYYLNAATVSEPIKKALTELAKRRREIAELTAQRQQREAQIEEIGRQQQRVRENMAQLDRASELYKRYVKDLSVQEDQIVELRKAIEALSAKGAELQKSLTDYIAGLELN